MLLRMAGLPIEIVPCPPSRMVEALALVLGDIAPSQRRQIAAAVTGQQASVVAGGGLFIALQGDRLRGAAWGQPQPGNTAVLWPPRLVDEGDFQVASQLISAVTRALDAAQIAMSQVLSSSRISEETSLLESAGFRQLAELIYMTCEAFRFPNQLPAATDLTFDAYDESQRRRLAELMERTYEGTLDCAVLNGTRNMDEVIDGYQATGAFRPENWLFVRADHRDVGVLLLTDHPEQSHRELMYMGLLPQARGHGWGEQIARYALWLSGQARVERVVLAVDAINAPARRMYENAGFIEWDRRTVFVRFLGGSKN